MIRYVRLRKLYFEVQFTTKFTIFTRNLFKVKCCVKVSFLNYVEKKLKIILQIVFKKLHEKMIINGRFWEVRSAKFRSDLDEKERRKLTFL